MVKQINTLHTKGFTRRSKVTKILGISISSLLPDIERLFASSDIAFLSIHFPFSNQANMPWIRDARVFRLEKAEKSARQPSAESIRELIRDASGRRAYSPDCCVLRAPRLVSIFFLRRFSRETSSHSDKFPREDAPLCGPARMGRLRVVSQTRFPRGLESREKLPMDRLSALKTRWMRCCLNLADEKSSRRCDVSLLKADKFLWLENITRWIDEGL